MTIESVVGNVAAAASAVKADVAVVKTNKGLVIAVAVIAFVVGAVIAHVL